MPSDENLRSRALALVSRSQLGVFMTCGADGHPQGRWMHVMPVDGLRTLYALSGDGTAKINDLESCPKVSWLFTGDAFGDIIRLTGTAAVRRDFGATRKAWDHLNEAVRGYAIGPASDDEHLQLVTIETTVDRVEVISPELDVTVARDVSPT